MDDWLSVTSLSEKIGTPETTIRRHLNHFKGYFRSEKIGRGRKYHVNSIEILQRIAALYNQDYERSDIEKILAHEYAFELADQEDSDDLMTMPTYDIAEKIDELNRKQELFNKELLDQLSKQQKYIEVLLSEREVMSERLKRLPSPEQERDHRVEQILAERKITRLLEEKALKSWAEKPDDERMIKTGWIRKEENLEKRRNYIRKYVDKYFEEYLKREFDME